MCARCDKLRLTNSEDIIIIDDFADMGWTGMVHSSPLIVDRFADFRFDGMTPLNSNYRGTIALQIDGVGDRLPVFEPLLITTTDSIPGDTDTTASLTVNAPHTFSTIDTIGDQDFYSVTLTAGTAYQIGMYAQTGGASLTPLADSYVEIYDADGNLVVSGDGGADTPLNQANSGFDVLLDFTPTSSGTYYVNARAFDNAPADGTNGDMVGDYELFVQTAPPGAYDPYYEPSDPLYAIDWGSQVNRVNQSARNPDGNEGARATGNAQDDPMLASAIDIPALAAAQGKNIDGKNVITVYFAKAGDVFTSLEDPTSPGLPPATVTAVGVQQFERDAVFTSLMEFEKVADIIYLEVQDRSHADFVYTSYQGTPGPGVSLLGSMSPPDEPDEGLAQFNSGDERWNALNLQQGGFSFVTLIHEFGHGHGLAHPHDNGGRSGILNGVEAEGAGVADYTIGNFGLNQGVFTMMSYEDGWQESPHGNAPTNVGYGYLGGLMAFDVAAIQDKYGVNEEWATGNDTYTLKDVNAAGTYYSAIWDGGGTDQIVYTGARNATIDLRAATLQYEVGGGGRVSFADGIFGGYTIANGVTIENATSGSGNDNLFGNAVSNILSGNAGNDNIDGGAGNDRLSGGLGNDFIEGGSGADTMIGGAGDDSYVIDNGSDRVFETVTANTADVSDAGGIDTVSASITINMNAYNGIRFVERAILTGTAAIGVTGNALANHITGNSGGNMLDGGAGADTLTGGRGNDIYIVDDSGDIVSEAGGDGVDTVKASLSYALIADIENLELTGTGNTNATGNATANRLTGNAANNILDGGAGTDTLVGGAGNDTYLVDSSGDRIIETITVSQTATNDAGGIDTIRSSVALYMNAYASISFVENAVLTGTAAASVYGNGVANSLTGNDTFNTLDGANGDDTLLGLGGNDTLIGGLGSDNLDGGIGRDRLNGGAGQDILTGGTQDDVFVFSNGDLGVSQASADRISDWSGRGAQGDRIDLSAIDANSGNGSSTNEAFSFIGSGAFTNVAGQLRSEVISGDTYLLADTNGDSIADLWLRLDGVVTVVARDFAL